MSKKSRRGVMKKPPVLAPETSGLMRLSKAALADLVWSFAGRCAACTDDPDDVNAEILGEWSTVARHRHDTVRLR